MIYSQAYSDRYDPPMPVVQLSVPAADGRPVHFEAIVDTGADATMLPLSFLDAIAAQQAGWVRVAGISGISRRLPTFARPLSLGDLALGNVLVIGQANLETSIVGRDVLNHLILTLNGLANVIEIIQ